MLTIVAADTRDAYSGVERIFLPVGVGVFVLFGGAIVVMVLLGRRRRAPRARADNRPLELAYVGVLAVTAAILVAVTFHAQARVGRADAGATLRIRVVAAKWRWRFEYPAQRFAIQGTEDRAPTLVVPAGADVEFEGVSLDVTHAFWIPAVRFQRQLFPQRPSRFAITFPERGFLSSSRCSFFCGLRHQDMRFGVDVLAPDEFRRWARAHTGAA